MNPDSTLALFNFNGVSGCDLFSVDNYERISANVVFWNSISKSLGVRDVEFTGHATGGFDYNYGYVVGYQGGAHYQVACTGGTMMPCDDRKALAKLNLRQASNQYRGLVGLSGNSGASGDFNNLYGLHGSVGHGDPKFVGVDTTGFSIKLSDTNVQRLSEHISYIETLGGSAGTGGNYTIKDTLNNCVGFSAGHIYALYQDLWTFRQNLIEDVYLRECEIDNSSCDDSKPSYGFSTIASKTLTRGGINSNKVSNFDQNNINTGLANYSVQSGGNLWIDTSG